MSTITSNTFKEGTEMAEQNENNLQFDKVVGADDLIKVSVIDNDGTKQPVALIETFSKAQFDLFDRLEERSRNMTYGVTHLAV